MKNYHFCGPQIMLPHAISNDFQNIQSKSNNFAFIGKADRRKSPLLTLMAWRMFVREKPQAKLYFLANGGSLLILCQILTLILRIHGVEFKKQLTRVEYLNIIQEINTLVIPSKYESFSYVAHQGAKAEKNLVFVRENWNANFKPYPKSFFSKRKIHALSEIFFEAFRNSTGTFPPATIFRTESHASVAERLVSEIHRL